MTDTATNSNSMGSSSALAIDDPRHHYASAVGSMMSLVADLDPGALDRETPCETLNVRSMLGHLACVLGRTAAMGNGSDPFEVPDLVTGVADDGWLAALGAAAGEVHGAWQDDAKLGQMYTLPWATMPGGAVLAMYTNEIVVHSWDVARGAGATVEFDDDVVEAVLAAMQAGLPADGRRESFEEVLAQMPEQDRPTIMPFEDVVPTDAQAPPLTRLVAWNGRRP